MSPKISVVIPTLNEEKYIGKVLAGLGIQTLRNFETIVVDGGSTDATAGIAAHNLVIRQDLMRKLV